MEHRGAGEDKGGAPAVDQEFRLPPAAFRGRHFDIAYEHAEIPDLPLAAHHRLLQRPGLSRTTCAKQRTEPVQGFECAIRLELLSGVTCIVRCAFTTKRLTRLGCALYTYRYVPAAVPDGA